MGCASSKEASDDAKTAAEPVETVEKRGSRFTVDISNQQLTVFPSATFAVQPKKLIAKNNMLSRTHPEFAKEYASVEDVDLSSNRFTRIPDVLSQLPRLTKVDISYNAFAKTGACDVVPSLSKLTTLICAGSGFKLLPPSLLASRTLTTLDLSRNAGLNLAKVPMERLSSLKTLSIAYCELAGAPPAGLKTVKLVSLNISGNPLLELTDPKGFGVGQRSLTELIADEMKWCELPRTVCALNGLTTLSIRSNPLEHLSGIGFLNALTSLDISSCQLCEIPADIDQAERLATLIADGNHFTIPTLPMSLTEPLACLGNYARLRALSNIERCSFAQSPTVPAELIIAASNNKRLHSVSWMTRDGVDAVAAAVLPMCFVGLAGLGEINHHPCNLMELHADASQGRVLASLVPKVSAASPPNASPGSGTTSATATGIDVVPTRWLGCNKSAVANFETWLRQIDSARNAFGLQGYGPAARRYRASFAATMQFVSPYIREGANTKSEAPGDARSADQSMSGSTKLPRPLPMGSQADGYFALGPHAAGKNGNTTPQTQPINTAVLHGPMIAPLDVAVIHLAVCLKRFAMTRHAGVVDYGELPPTPPSTGAAFWALPCPDDIGSDGPTALRWRSTVTVCEGLSAAERQVSRDWCPWQNPMELEDADDSLLLEDDLGALGLTEQDVKRVFVLASAVAGTGSQNVASDAATQTYVMLLGAAAAHAESQQTRVFLSLEHQLAMILHSLDTDAFVADCAGAGLRNVTHEAPGRVTDYFESGDAALGRTASLWETLYDSAFRAGRPGIVSCWA